MSNKIDIKEYFEKGLFVIPDYQRGYKWSVNEKNEDSSTEFFVDSLLKAFHADLQEYFIEAVTVVEENGNIILIDGQQRTTTLFLVFYCLNRVNLGEVQIQYDVRKDSNIWLQNLILDSKSEEVDQNTQDIYYFKKAIEQIKNRIAEVKKNDFLSFIETKVFLLYNVIPKEKAVNTFISLNGLKALMKQEELIKSDLLIKSSRIEYQPNIDQEDQFGIEWKTNEDRGRLARNWDKWLYWWNKPDIKNYFGISLSQHPLYYLLVTYWNINSITDNKKEFSFYNFKNEFISSVKNAKYHFEGLRKLQKTFEDFYSDYLKHNYLGLILKTSNSKEESLRYFLDTKKSNKHSLLDYAKWSLVGATHLEILNNTTEKITIDDNVEIVVIIKKQKANDVFNLINEKYVYWNENDLEYKDARKEFTFRVLLFLNLMEDSRLNRKFDFRIWDHRSLEHIYPKSKSDDLNFSENKDFIEGSIHCIGNLVLLYGRDNSSFSAKDFIDKKNTYFDTSEQFRSRHLLHTISVFSNSEWKEKEIIENKRKTIKQLESYYEL